MLTIRPICFLVALCLVATSVPAADIPQTVGIFLQLDGLPGDSADAEHKGQIELQSFSLSGQRGAGEGEKANLSEFFVLKPLDAASPKLLEALATGKTFANATISVQGSFTGQQPRQYIRYDFTELTVSRINQVVSGGGQEELNFRFKTVKVTYTTADGKKIEAGSEG